MKIETMSERNYRAGQRSAYERWCKGRGISVTEYPYAFQARREPELGKQIWQVKYWSTRFAGGQPVAMGEICYESWQTGEKLYYDVYFRKTPSGGIETRNNTNGGVW